MENQEKEFTSDIINDFEEKTPIEIIEELTKNIRIPITQQILNLQDAAGIQPTEDFDDRTEYREYIIRKHS